MEKGTAEKLARSLMAQHLTGWTFKWDRAVMRLGQCVYRTKTISLSLPLTEASDEAVVRNTILHEIAHALAGPTAKHGPDWKRIAVRLGANPKSATSEGGSVMELAPWVGTCPAGHVSPRRFFRKPRAIYSCSQCAPDWKAENIIQYRKVAVPAGVR